MTQPLLGPQPLTGPAAAIHHTPFPGDPDDQPPEREPLALRAPATLLPHDGLSPGLLARAQHGWDTFMARTGPLPGEDEAVEHNRADEVTRR
ncbi:hypothetical protein GCM10009654_23950 [Streptomyces hebeiensis]|uniref:Uncharacterized protein n=1 Tax=Streptomyces hebeiensis TaxID=229486 RepID=A0ABN1UTZ2_9ACTN